MSEPTPFHATPRMSGNRNALALGNVSEDCILKWFCAIVFSVAQQV
ncbi:hypothetical protein RQM67_08800 [Citrobacter koseri]|nr:hypothetical protein [Citrobacter koseri]MDT7494516.1 hypothetical protein [Citrobacter koseri]